MTSDARNSTAGDIRWAVRDDLPKLVHLENRIARDSDHVVGPFDFLGLLLQRASVLYVAEGSNHQGVLGYMGVDRLKLSDSKIQYTIARIGVDPLAQRSGQGTRLIKRVVNRAMQNRLQDKQRGISVAYNMACVVPDDMLSVHLFLEAMKFTAVESRNNAYRFERSL